MDLLQWHLLGIFISSVWSGAIQMTSSNVDSILSSNELVFMNFYANWCRFSQMLNPIYDQLAEKVKLEFPQSGLVAIAKVDCDAQSSIASKYHVDKYPTLKFARHGIVTKREYRGARQVDAFVEFLRQQIQSAIIKLSTSADFDRLEKKKAYIIGHFDSEQSENYQTFTKVASLLRDDCLFAASTDKDAFPNERSPNDSIYFHPSQSSGGKDQPYTGLVNNEQSFYTWSHDRCLPLVREITFENAEELTDEGLPFLILFHHLDDHQSVTLFERQVAKQLRHQTSTINCLHADGAKFAHPLKHLGKTTSDLPLVVIDSFKHMFLFPDINTLSVDGKLLQFVQDLHSGKLHREFHQPSTTSKISGSKKGDSNRSSPPESIFIHLSPSRQRYSFRDEL